jgi:hypothetical protein
MGTPLSSARSPHTSQARCSLPSPLRVTVTSYFADLYRISIALAAATVILLFGYRIAVMG